MATGVYGEHGAHVPGRVVVDIRHDIDHVTVLHLQMVVLLAQE